MIAFLMSLVTATYLSCNQEMYDTIYRTLIIRTINSKLTERDFKIRNDAIENLRKLCHGQKSSWETK